ncbi:hypothetical protein [Chryseobacterium sp. R2A-55]|uniref:hypothetical protein n=1 Tax=Chryseobacterium sp. R2A-55 TaxID=2744445 RepID=UPI001F307867|nr:hypothetical protein [Chryseobacterium sp. R2A-55]
MARQKGIVKLKGTMGDITFYRTRDGYMAREKGGITAERMRNDPAFQRTRENMAEFGRAGKAGKMLRASFQALLRTAADPRMVGRLTKEMVKVIQLDPINPRGQRTVVDGDMERLAGFEFNINAKLGTTFYAPYVSTLDRESNTAGVSIDPFVPTDSIAAPAGSTHFKLVCGSSDLDFQTGVYTSEVAESDTLPLSNVPTTLLELENGLPTGSTHPQFLILGINFYQEVNGTFYELKNGAFNALQIVKISGTP